MDSWASTDRASSPPPPDTEARARFAATSGRASRKNGVTRVCVMDERSKSRSARDGWKWRLHSGVAVCFASVPVQWEQSARTGVRFFPSRYRVLCRDDRRRGVVGRGGGDEKYGPYACRACRPAFLLVSRFCLFSLFSLSLFPSLYFVVARGSLTVSNVGHRK